MKEIVNLSNIYKSFGAVQALIDFNVSINEGEIVGLMGDNGAGKSTILKAILGTLDIKSGEIFLLEKKITGIKPSDIVRKGVDDTNILQLTNYK